MVAGDVEALVPRNRAELWWAAGLSVNAGVVEELFFRLALPTLLFAATGNFWVAIVASMVVFGFMHWYQGVVGVAATMFIGAFMMALYLATGSLLLVMLLHAIIDLRSLVISPLLRMRRGQ